MATGTNNRSNPYYQRVNHIKLARESVTRSELSSTTITATLTPATSVLVSGQALNETTNWATFLLTSNYASTAGTISTVTVNYIGDTPDATTALWGDDTNHFSITVTDSAANARTFTTLARTVVQTDFVMTFEGTSFTMTLGNIGTYNATIQVDDTAPRTVTTHNDADLVYTGLSAGTHTLRMRGTVPWLNIGANATDRGKVRTVTNLGHLGATRMQEAFVGCTGMTSFAAGNADTSNVTNWYGAFKSLSALVSFDFGTMSFEAATTCAEMFAQSTALVEPFDFTRFTATAAPTDMNEMFFGTPSGPNLPNLDPSGLDISNLQDNGSYGGGLFNFLNNRNLSTAIYDQLLINWAAQLPTPNPFNVEAGEGFISDFQLSQPTMGGAVETARRALINAGFYLEDAETVAPDQMAAPSLTVDGPTQITITRNSRPFAGGLPIRYYDYRYSTDETNWTVVSGALDDQWTSKVLAGLTDNTTYYVQIRARNAIGAAGAWSVSISISTPIGGPVSIDSTDPNNPGINIPPSMPDAQPVSLTVDGVTYTEDYAATPLTAGMFRTGPVCLTRPSWTGTFTQGQTVTIVPGIFFGSPGYLGEPTMSAVNTTDGAITLVGLNYTLTAGDVGDQLRATETFEGLSVDSNLSPVIVAA